MKIWLFTFLNTECVGIGMTLLWYGLPHVSSISFRAEKVGLMADSKIRTSLSVECRNQILHAIAYSTEPYYIRAMDICIWVLLLTYAKHCPSCNVSPDEGRLVEGKQPRPCQTARSNSIPVWLILKDEQSYLSTCTGTCFFLQGLWFLVKIWHI